VFPFACPSRSSTSRSQDVTEEAIDVEARIQSLTAERDQLRQLLGKAGAINDVFTIEREIARVQADIDSLQRRLDHLRNTSALAELDARFDKRLEPGPVSKFFGAIGRGIGRLFVR
jgi:GTP1/Obg family GTP-binding protein